MSTWRMKPKDEPKSLARLKIFFPYVCGGFMDNHRVTIEKAHLGPYDHVAANALPSWRSLDYARRGGNPLRADGIMFTPRKGVERTKSASSAVPLPSNPHIFAAPSSDSDSENGNLVRNGDQARPGLRKKRVKAVWPAPKTEPLSGISTAKAQSQSTPSSGQSASSTMSAVNQAVPLVPFSNRNQPQTPKNDGRLETPRPQPEATPILSLHPMTGAFQRKCIRVPYFPDVLRIGRQTNAKTVPTTTNGYFDSKVLSRQHAVIWADANGRIWIRDVKSSNGTFVNGLRLSSENRDSEPHELREHDTLELGIDIVSEDQKSIVHHKVSAKVEQAGIYTNGANLVELNSGEWGPGPGNGLMSPMPGKQISQGQERVGNQGSMVNNGRLIRPTVVNPNLNGMAPQWDVNSWMNSITIEQVFKKLTTELKQAKRQTQDLHRTSNFFSTLLTLEPGEEHTKWQPENRAAQPQTNGILPCATTDNISPFSQPPAPPPQRPLPEKPELPNNLDWANQDSLKKKTNEKSKSLRGLPSRPEPPSSHILSLVEALTVAKREIDAQDSHLNHLEVLLRREREARETAEEYARHLMEGQNIPPDVSQGPGAVEKAVRNGAPKELHSHLTNGHAPKFEEAPPSPSSASVKSNDTITKSTGEIQNDADSVDTSSPMEKLNSMVREMEEMKLLMESYKQRAEGAENERNGLAKMVERLRAAGPTESNDKPTPIFSSNIEPISPSPAIENPLPSFANADTATPPTSSPSSPLKTKSPPPVHANGVLPSATTTTNTTATTPVYTKQRTHSLSVIPSSSKLEKNERSVELAMPYLSMVGVLLVGVGIMTWLNGWQKGES